MLPLNKNALVFYTNNVLFPWKKEKALTYVNILPWSFMVAVCWTHFRNKITMIWRVNLATWQNMNKGRWFPCFTSSKCMVSKEAHNGTTDESIKRNAFIIPWIIPRSLNLLALFWMCRTNVIQNIVAFIITMQIFFLIISYIKYEYWILWKLFALSFY